MDLVKFTALIKASHDDVHYVHLKAKGKGFDTLHNVSEDYYKHLFSDYDDFAELCIMQGYQIVHPSNSAKYVDYIIEHNSYDVFLGFTKIDKIIGDLLKAAKELHSNTEDLVAKIKLENFIEYWTKEIEYKNRRRLS